MTAEMIKCPSCGAEIPQDVENCPDCGAPISVIVNNDISGAPIDNSAAIDAMLRSASQFMEDSESLGLDELDIFEENEENSDEDNKEEDEVFEKVELNELPPELSKAQKDEIEAGGVIKLTPDDMVAAAPKKSSPKQKTASVSAESPSDSSQIGEPTDLPTLNNEYALTPESIPSVEPTPNDTPAPNAESEADNKTASKKPAKNKKEKKNKKSKKNENEEPVLFEVDENGNAVKGKKTKKSKDKKEKNKPSEKEKKEKKKGSPLKVIIAVVIALAVGICGGFLGKIFLFPDLPTPECQNFAQKAVAAAINEISGARELYIAEAYVKQGVFSTQCIFKAFSENEESAFSEWVRVKIDNDTERITVYFELSPDEYERLKNSENSDDRAKAAVLKSNQNELERCISEMKVGDGWNSANVSLINNELHPYTEVTTTAAESAEVSEVPDGAEEETVEAGSEEAE